MVPAPRGGKGNAPPLRFGVPETSPSPYAAVRLPNFRRFIIGLFAFTMAIQIQGTVVGWQIYELTHDKLALGLIGLAEALPFIGAALYAGHVADRHDRRRIVLAALVLLLLSAALLLSRCRLLLPAAPRLVVRAIYGVDRHERAGAELSPAGAYGARRGAGAARAVRQRDHLAQRHVAARLRARARRSAGCCTRSAERRSPTPPTRCSCWSALAAMLAIRHRSEIKSRAYRSRGEEPRDRDPVRVGRAADPWRRSRSTSSRCCSAARRRCCRCTPMKSCTSAPSGLGLLRAAPAIGAVAMSAWLAWMPPFRRAGRALFVAVALVRRLHHRVRPLDEHAALGGRAGA